MYESEGRPEIPRSLGEYQLAIGGKRPHVCSEMPDSLSRCAWMRCKPTQIFRATIELLLTLH